MYQLSILREIISPAKNSRGFVFHIPYPWSGWISITVEIAHIYPVRAHEINNKSVYERHFIWFFSSIFSCPCLSIGFCAHLTIFSYNSPFTINWEGCIGFTIANKTFRDFFFPSCILINFFCKIKIEFMTAYNICTHIMLKGKERNLLDSDFLIQHFHFSSEFCSIEQFYSPTFCSIHA